MRTHVEAIARRYGWTPESREGAFEFVQRMSYRTGWEDGKKEAINPHRDTPATEKALTEREVGDCIDKTNLESQYGQHQFGWSKDLALNILAALIAKQPTPDAGVEYKPVGYLRSHEFDGHEWEPFDDEWPLGELLYAARAKEQS